MKVKKIMKIVGLILVVWSLINAGVFLYLNQKWRFNKGNDSTYAVENVKTKENSLLKGKKIIFLGSSVTKGAGAGDESFVDYLVKLDEIIATKEAVNGTTLTDSGSKSYIKRMESNIDPSIQADLFVVQLSTNDASKKKDLGSISDSKDRKEFDTSTIIGSMEYIISYAQDTWKCPIVFYTNTYYKSERYEEMVTAVKALQDKWGIGLINLYDDQEMTNVSPELRKLYMVDAIHPTKKGYLEWWTPKFETYLESYLK
ncbi:SGNH/GDSL hydrolase family protein [Streptococcus moroccensis]|uniref:Lysophospholipase L1-like esterase n=1 Tax=Streptococcus moroccensis TaxID=1451356 RepID=A0ABT9YQ40_9STRE|nr:SGNH/GDSL hydrolase family protein [Streptococcus moroccensis]MDQ0221839.1 lysophospholipase L1-like esterase [Streptococcus moroccensis]